MLVFSKCSSIRINYYPDIRMAMRKRSLFKMEDTFWELLRESMTRVQIKMGILNSYPLSSTSKWGRNVRDDSVYLSDAPLVWYFRHIRNHHISPSSPQHTAEVRLFFRLFISIMNMENMNIYYSLSLIQ